MYPGYACVHPWEAKPSCPFLPPHLHITLGGIDTVVQGLNGHPAHRETTLGKSGLEGWVKRKGLFRGLWGAWPGLEP